MKSKERRILNNAPFTAGKCIPKNKTVSQRVTF